MAIEVNLAGTMPSDGVVQVGLQMLYVAHQQTVAAHEAALALPDTDPNKPALVETTGEEVVKSAAEMRTIAKQMVKPRGPFGI